MMCFPISAGAAIGTCYASQRPLLRQPRTSPLLYIRDNGRLLVVGSNFGQSTHPAWTANLLADPNGIVTLGRTIVPVVATPINGTEYEELYTAFVNMASVYGGYRQKTDRTMRMFALTPQ